MCRYVVRPYKSHFVCAPCRRSFKHPAGTESRCPSCRTPMLDAGRDLAVPRRVDTAGWRALAAVLAAGLGFHGCGCVGPGFRPRTPAAVRVRLVVAGRFGEAPTAVLGRRDLEARLTLAGRTGAPGGAERGLRRS